MTPPEPLPLVPSINGADVVMCSEIPEDLREYFAEWMTEYADAIRCGEMVPPWDLYLLFKDDLETVAEGGAS